jgi:hypothetical protein
MKRRGEVVCKKRREAHTTNKVVVLDRGKKRMRE